jgi:hypothetical protein
MDRKVTWLAPALGFLALVFHGEAFLLRAEGARTREHNRIVQLLDEVISMKDFQNPMTLKEAMGLLMENLAQNGKDLPTWVDVHSFRAEDPEQPVYDTQIQFSAYPRQMSARQVLERILGAVEPPKNHKGNGHAAFLVRDGTVVITTAKQASVEQLLQRRVLANFRDAPFSEAMEELSAMTGASIVLDNRLGDKLKTPISASLRNDVTLKSALHMLADMADLKVVFLPAGIYITHPFNADNMQKELTDKHKRAPQKK